MAALDPNTVTDIRKVSKRLLAQSDAIEVFPTPVDRIVEVAGLVPTDDWLFSESKIRQARAEIRATLRGMRRKVRGTLDRGERVIYVDDGLDPNKVRFVKLHETTHHVLPWQQRMDVFADTDLTLSPMIERQYEQEANRGAAELLFQLDGFTRMASDYPTALSSPIELSQTFGASIHASIRRWAEGHDHALCVLILDQGSMTYDPMRIRVKYAVESASWRAQMGPSLFPRSLTPTFIPCLRELLSPLAWETEGTWQHPGRDGEVRSLLVESFSNSYDLFLLIRVPRKDKFFARRRGTATIVSR